MAVDGSTGAGSRQSARVSDAKSLNGWIMTSVPPSASVPSIPLPTRRPGEWSVGGAIVFALIVIGVAQLAGFILLQLWLGRSQTRLLDPQVMQGARGLAAAHAFVVVQLTVQVLQIALALMLAGWGGGHRSSALGLAPASLSLQRWLGLLGMFFAVKTLASVVAAGLTGGSPRSELEPFRALLVDPTTQYLFLVAVVLAGVSEELVFRGVLSRTFEATPLGFWAGAAVINGLFAVVHLQYGVGGQLVVFVIGMMLSWIRMRTGSLWPCIVCHAANNAIAFLAMRALL